MVDTLVRWTQDQMDDFFDQYLETALWSSLDDNGEPLNAAFDSEDFLIETKQSLWEDCRDFVLANMADLSGINPSDAGHNFWLSRNRHGAGFWDRGWGDKGDRLHEAATVYGSVHLWADDNGWVHAE